MADIDEIIQYIKTLRKGFDKDIFQSKVDELGFIIDSRNLNYDDFHTLFKLWLNLSIPITKWVSLGACLVPQEIISQATVDYSLRWILANYKDQNNFSRIAFLLDWLTAAMDCESVDINTLDSGYELFYTMLVYESLTPSAMKLVYTLTKPSDITRRRVLELIDYAKKREAKKNLYKQLQVLLGLFKSYKPECVPEDIPSISIHTAFKKINPILMMRFKNVQNNRNNLKKDSQQLFWVNPINFETGRNKKCDPLVPNMEFINIGAKQYEHTAPQKNYLDFSDPISLLQYSLGRGMRRPARLRALLCNRVGVMLLTAASDTEHAFLSHDLHHLLTNCFLDSSAYSHTEKRDLLQRLATLQSTLMQGLPVVTRFLAQFLPFWNEKDFYSEILELVEWVNVEEVKHVQVILDTLSQMYHRSQPAEQSALLRTITTMYTNTVYASSRSKQYFMSMKPSESNFTEVLSLLCSCITDTCNKALQTSPEDIRTLYSCTNALVRTARASAAADECAGADACAGAGVPVLLLALPLLSPSAILLDNLAGLILSYKKIVSIIKARNGSNKYVEQMQVLKAFTADFVSCFYEKFLSGRRRGIVFNRLHPQLVSKMDDLVPDVDSKLSIRNHFAFAPYTYVELDAMDLDADNKFWFDAVVDGKFKSLSQFVKMAMPEIS